ncbi:DUF6438 domain-containing protein [Pacificimonas flava]|nr:DUF6438 domain-containing protein [Pacificimonas flava]MBB5281423.1 hypothetical protein [Pacificimonas flava]
MRNTCLAPLALGAALAACTSMNGPAAPPDQAASAQPASIGYSVGPCFGFCPVYSVEADANGEVTFVGEQHTAVSGEKVGRISSGDYQAAVEALAPFRPAEGTTADVECGARTTDQQQYRITWQSVADGPETVLNYYAGCRSAEAQRLRAVLNGLPETLGIEDWAEAKRPL